MCDASIGTFVAKPKKRVVRSRKQRPVFGALERLERFQKTSLLFLLGYAALDCRLNRSDDIVRFGGVRVPDPVCVIY